MCTLLSEEIYYIQQNFLKGIFAVKILIITGLLMTSKSKYLPYRISLYLFSFLVDKHRKPSTAVFKNYLKGDRVVMKCFSCLL
jgi:hypothetical protein